MNAFAAARKGLFLTGIDGAGGSYPSGPKRVREYFWENPHGPSFGPFASIKQFKSILWYGCCDMGPIKSSNILGQFPGMGFATGSAGQLYY